MPSVASSSTSTPTSPSAATQIGTSRRRSYLKPGPNQKLNGRSALWYARGRYGSDDFARMDRQRCVINAIIKQANPTNMLARYEDIVKAGKQLVYTDMPREVLPLMVDLSLRVKDGNVRSVVFKSGVAGFHSSNPDFALMRKRVKAAISESKHPKAAKKKSGGTIQSEMSTTLRVRSQGRRDSSAVPLSARQGWTPTAKEVVGSRGRRPGACRSRRSSAVNVASVAARGLTTVASAPPPGLVININRGPCLLTTVDHGPGTTRRRRPLMIVIDSGSKTNVVRSRTVSTSATTASTTREDHDGRCRQSRLPEANRGRSPARSWPQRSRPPQR